MNIILIFLFLTIIFEIIILGIIYSNIKITILNIEYAKINNQTYIDKWDVYLTIYLYKIIPIAKIKIHKKYIEIFKIKFYYKKIKNPETDIETFKKIYNILNKEFFKRIEFKIEKFNLYLNFGTENIALTTSLTFLISNFITRIIRKNIKNYNQNKYKFIIKPNYININNYNICFKSELKLKTIKLISYLNYFKKNNNINA